METDTLDTVYTDLDSTLADIVSGVEARYTYIPSLFQRLFHESMKRVRGLFTANRVGKSTAAAHECDWIARGEHPYQETPDVPVRIRVLGDGYEHGIDKVLIPIFKSVCNPKYLQGGSWATAYAVGEHTLTYANGSTIEFMSYKLGDLGRGAQMFAGVELDLLWADEHCPPEVWAENQARIGKRALRSIVTLTPVLGKTWEYEEIWERWQRGEPGYECFTASIQDNPYLDQEAVAAFLGSIGDPNLRDVREHGTWINLGGAVYPMFERQWHLVPFDAKRVASATKTVLIDPHESRAKGDHVLWCGVDQDQRMFCYREWIAKIPVTEIADGIRSRCSEDSRLNEDIRRWFMDGAGIWWNVDQHTGMSVAQQYQDAGIPVQPASRDKQGGIKLMQTALEVSPSKRRATFEVMDTCPETAIQFEKYRWKPQTMAMTEADRWVTIDERDDLVTLARYYVQTNPRYMGQAVSKDAIKVTGAGVRIHRAMSGQSAKGMRLRGRF